MEESLVYAVKAIDRASPALYGVARSMKALQNAAFGTRNALGQFKKSWATKMEVRLHKGFEQSFQAIARGASVAWRGINRFITGTIRAFRAAARWAWNLYKRILMVVAAMAALGAAALATGLGIATKQAAAFELASAKVRGVTGATTAEMKVLDATMRDLAKTSIYTAGQFYEAGYFLASAGFAPDQIRASIQGVTKLAEALGADLGQATETVVSTLSAFNMASRESTRIANVFAAANAASQATMEKLGNALIYVAPLAGSLNIRFEETVAALNLLFNAGLRGMMAGRSLQSMLATMLSPTSEVTKVLKQLGLTLEDIDPKAHGLAGAFGALFEAGMTTGQAVKFFGKENIKTWEILRGAGIPALIAMEKQITGTNQAFEQAAIQMDTLANRWKYLVSSLQELGLVFGTPITKPLKNILKMVADFINKLSETKAIRSLAKVVGAAFQRMEKYIKGTLEYVDKHWPEVWEKALKTIKWIALGVAGVVGAIIGAIRFLVAEYPKMAKSINRAWETIALIHAKAVGFIARILAALEAAVKETGKSSVWAALAEIAFETFRTIAKAALRAAMEMLPAFGAIATGLAVLVAGAALLQPSLAPLALKIGLWAAGIHTAMYGLGQAYLKISALKYEDVGKGLSDALGRATDAIGGDFAGALRKAWNSPEVKAAGSEAENVILNMFGVLDKRAGAAGADLGDSFIGGMLKSIASGSSGARQLMADLLTQAAAAGGGPLGGAGGAGAIPGGAADIPGGAAALSEKFLKYAEQLGTAMGEILGPLALLERQMEYTRIHIAQLDDSVERQTEAMEKNTEALRSGMEERWEKMPIAEMEKWARLHIAKTLHQEMRPSTLEYLVPGHRQLAEKELIRVLMKNGMYMSQVEDRLARMTHGEMRGAAQTEWENYTTRMLDYQEQMVQYQEKQLEAQRASLAAQMAALERQKEAMLSQQKLAALLVEMEKFKVAAQKEGITFVKGEWDKIIERVKALYDKVQGPTDIPGGGKIPGGGVIPGTTPAVAPPAPPPTFGPGMVTPTDPGKGTILIPGTSGQFPEHWPGQIAGRPPYHEPIAPMIPPPGSTFGPIDPIARRPNTIIIGPNGIDIQIINPPDATPEDIADAVADGMANFVEESGIAMGAAGLPAR